MLVFVTGPPAAGKTSLAVPLARKLDLPLLSKDAIKEAIHDELPSSGSEAWSRHLSDASYRVLLSLLRNVPSAVIDLNLPTEWAERFGASGPSLLQVFCRCPQAELERRLVERATARHPAHHDDVLLDEIRAQGVRGSEPAPLDCPLLEVETSAPVDIGRVSAWVTSRAS